MDFNGNFEPKNLSISNLTITDKGIIQKEIDEFTDSKELVSKEYVDASGENNPFNQSLNTTDMVEFVSVTAGNIISLEQKTQNQTAIAGITTLAGELDVQKIKSYEHNVELEFDDTNAILTATNINLSGIVNLDNVITTTQTIFNDDELVTKLYVDDNINLQNSYDRGPGILTKIGTPLTITGPAGIETGSNIKVYDDDGVSGYATFVSYGNIILKDNDDLITSYGSVNYLSFSGNKLLRLQVNKGNDIGATSSANIEVDSQIFGFRNDQLDMNSKKIAGLTEPTDAQDATTKNYVDTTNFQNYSFRNVNNKSTLGVPGNVPPYNGSNPIITNQSELPQGDYYMRYGANVNICLKSLSDSGDATGDDVYQTTLDDFWDKSKFPSVTHNYNRSIPINADTFSAFTDNYIRIGWNSPGNDIELTIFQLPAGVSGIYSLAVPHFDASATVQTLITTTGLVTDIFPNGLNVANSLVNVYINPSSNPTDDKYPSYNVQFRRVDDVIFMKLDRYFMTTVV